MPPRKDVPPCSGSSNSVDESRFVFDEARKARVRALRDELDLPENTPVVGFVGRFTRDKGSVELAGAFRRVRERLPNARLLLVGDFDEGDPVSPEVEATLRADPAVSVTGFVDDVVPY